MRLYYLGLFFYLLAYVQFFASLLQNRISRLFRVFSFNPWGASLIGKLQVIILRRLYYHSGPKIKIGVTYRIMELFLK